MFGRETTRQAFIPAWPFSFCFLLFAFPKSEWYLPIRVAERQSWQRVQLTTIGAFGLQRKARPQVAAHYHAGVDFKRPGNNYFDEPIFPANRGVVISLRTDGPFAQIMIEHCTAAQDTLWTVYEHVAGVRVVVGDTVSPRQPMARFMNTEELNLHGWQFDHLHFEILKRRPHPIPATRHTPQRRFKSYNLDCYTRENLKRYYHDPREFFERCWSKASQKTMTNNIPANAGISR